VSVAALPLAFLADQRVVFMEGNDGSFYLQPAVRNSALAYDPPYRVSCVAQGGVS
jgi:hypothetical protein